MNSKLKTLASKLPVGVLAIHGSVAEHAAVLRGLNFEVVEVRAPRDLENLGGLILPGGESTTIGDLAQKFKIVSAIKKFARSGRPILGTCAGLILLAQFGLLDAQIERNAYGRQLESFEADLKIAAIGAKKFPGIFIRAPKILAVSQSTEVLAKFDGQPILIRQQNLWGATFHPELADDPRVHQLIFQK